jgi:DNA-binding NarL/FixJ family response regulator
MKLERLQVCPASARQGSRRAGISAWRLAGRAVLDRQLDPEQVGHRGEQHREGGPISNASRPLAISMRPVSPPRCSDVRSVLTAAGWTIIRSMVENGLRVVLAEDDLLLREGLASLLERSGFQVVGQAGDATALLALVDAHDPELVVVDIRMPPSHTAEGLDAARQIRHHHPGTGILVLSAHVEVEHAMELLASGRGVGYLLKSRVTDLGEFLDTLSRIAKGGSVVDPALVAELVAARHRDDPLASLSAREREVLGLMAEGRSNAGIARRLWVTEGTVEKHVRSILTKLGLAETDDDHRRVLAVLTFLDAR